MSKKKQQYESLKQSLNIDETLIKAPTKRTRQYNKVNDSIPIVEDYNFMADILFLPETKQKFKYLFTIVGK